jgi:hypothetical protein
MIMITIAEIGIIMTETIIEIMIIAIVAIIDIELVKFYSTDRSLLQRPDVKHQLVNDALRVRQP